MGITTNIKYLLNKPLKKFNIKIDTYTAQTFEENRIEQLNSKGFFDKEIYDINSLLDNYDPLPLLDSLKDYKERFNNFNKPEKNNVNYSYANDYYTSPDTEILYAIIRKYQPKKIIEIGCGNSTKISRQAIIDGKLKTKIISIDPYPRIEIAKYSDEVYKEKLEDFYFDKNEILFDLEPNDIFFIDSSHQIKIGNDVTFIYNLILPKLPKGVIIHIHDIYLPYEYPLNIVNTGWQFLEQYLLHALLVNSQKYELLWAGYYNYKNIKHLIEYFPNYKGTKPPLSFWIMRK